MVGLKILIGKNITSVYNSVSVEQHLSTWQAIS